MPGSDNFVIFEFPHEFDSEVVYVDSDTAQRIYEERNPVRQYTYAFHAALDQALPARADPHSHGGAVTPRPGYPTPTPHSTMPVQCLQRRSQRRIPEVDLQQRQRWLPVLTLSNGLIGFQDDKLPHPSAKLVPSSSHNPYWAAFITGAKNGDFDHLLD